MAIEKFPDEISKIRVLLSGNPAGLTIRSISEMIGINRNSTAKYLAMLQMQGSVTLKRNGPSKVYCLANKLPAEVVLKLAKSNVILLDEALSVIDVNDSMQDLLKISKMEIIKKTIDQLPLSVQSQPCLSALIKEGLEGKESKKPAVIESGNRSIPCLLAVSPVYFENGNSGVSVIIDFLYEPEKQKMPESGFNRSFIDLDEIEYCCQFEPDGTLTYVNTAYCEMLQKSKSELLGQNWLPVIPEKESRKIQINLASLDPAHPVLTSEFRVIGASGESFWQRWKFRGIFDATGQIIQFQGVGLDISELKKAAEKLGAIEQDLENLSRDHKTEILEINRELYTEISKREKGDFQLQFTQFSMDNASVFIIWTDRDGRFIYLNKNAQKILGHARRELLTKKIYEILSAGTVLDWEEVWKQIEQNHYITFETSFETRDGRDIPVEIILNYLEYKEKQYCCCFATDITLKKQNNAAKRESELRFKSIFHSMFQFIALVQPDGKVLEVNDTALTFGGLDSLEVIGKPFWETYWWTISTQTQVQVRNAIARAARGVSVRYTVDVIGKGNTVATIDFLLKPVVDESGIVTSIIAEGYDITERVRADAALKASEVRYRSLFENMIEGYAYCKILFHHDIPGDFIYIDVNSAFEKLTGLVNVTEKKASEVIPGIHTSNPKLLQIYSRVALTGKTEQFETFIKSLGIYLAITVYSQKKDYFTVVFENITERKQAEEALLKNSEELRAFNEQLTASDEELRQMLDNLTGSEEALQASEEKYRMLFNNAGDAIFIHDVKMRILAVNLLACERLGYTQAELMSMSINEVDTPEQGQYIQDRLARIMEQGLITFETEHQRKDGSSVPTEVSTRQIMWEGQPALMSICRDITERRRAEERIRWLASFPEMNPNPVIEMDAQGIITFANRATLNTLRDLGLPENPETFVPEDKIEILRLMREGNELQIYREITLNSEIFAEFIAFNQEFHVVRFFIRNITDRKKAVDELRLHSEIVQNMAEGVAMIHLSDGNIAYANPRFESMFGYNPGELSGKHISAINAPDIKSPDNTANVIIRELMQTGVWSGEVQNLRKDGTTFWCHATISTFDHPQYGKVWVSVYMDITKHKRAEEALRKKYRSDLKASHDSLQKTEADLHLHQTELEVQNEELRQIQHNLEVSREQYFELYDLAPVGHLTLNEKGLILNANLTAATLLGVERHQLLKKLVSRYILPDDQDIFYHCRKEVVETRERMSCELRMLHSEDSPFRVQIIAVPAPAGEGEGVAISLIPIDNAGRKQTDEALQKNEKIFHAMFKSHNSVMLLVEPETGKIVDVNRAAEYFYGRSDKELCAQSIDDINILPPEEVAALRAKIVRKEVTVFTARHRLASGEIKTVEVHSSPIVIGKKTVLFSIIHDLTDKETSGRDAAGIRDKDYDLR